MILSFREAGWTIRAIARRLDRSPSCVCGFLNRPARDIETRGRKRKLSERDDRRIWRMASNARTSSKRIRADLRLPCSPRTVLRSINRSPNIVYRRMRKGPKTSPAIRRRRVLWVNAFQNPPDRFDNIIFLTKRSSILMGRMDTDVISEI